MKTRDSCGLCHKTIGQRRKSIRCDYCDQLIHIRCNNINVSTYDKLVDDPTPWFCRMCIGSSIPFSSLTDLELNSTLSGKTLNLPNYNLTECPQYLKTLFKELNNVNSAINCKYFDINDLNQFRNKKNMSSYMHLNIASLPSHIDELRSLITSIDMPIDVIGITESKLRHSDPNITNVNTQGYSIKHMPSDANKGGALLYINETLNYKSRKDLEIQKSKELESTFIEVIKPREKNILIGCIYRHPSMSIKEFNNDFLKNLLEKITLENKDIVLLGDYNINLLNYDNSPDVAIFLESMCSHSLFPSITQPTRVTSKSRTLIDNVFINFHSPDIISGKYCSIYLGPPSSNNSSSIQKVFRKTSENI